MFLPGLTVLVCIFESKLTFLTLFHLLLFVISLHLFKFLFFFKSFFPLVQVTLYSPHLLFVIFNFSNILNCPYIVGDLSPFFPPPPSLGTRNP